jgi:hypothetical protein
MKPYKDMTGAERKESDRKFLEQAKEYNKKHPWRLNFLRQMGNWERVEDNLRLLV